MEAQFTTTQTENYLATEISKLFDGPYDKKYFGFDIDYNVRPKESWATIDFFNHGQIDIEYDYDFEIREYRNDPESHSKLIIHINRITFVDQDDNDYDIIGKAWEIIEERIQCYFNADEVIIQN